LQKNMDIYNKQREDEKVWNGKLLPMCYSCWSKWINGGRK